MKSKQGNPKLAVACIRASTDRQENTAEVQLTAMRKWAAENEVTIVAVFEEIGVSGGLPIEKRPTLLAAIAELRPRNAGLLLFAERTRISRDATTSALVQLGAQRAGARIATAADGDATDPGAQLLAGILDHVSQFERAQIRGRIQAALDAKAARGERTGGIPYGMQLAADGVHLEPNPAEQAIIAKIRQLRAEGVSQIGITEALERAHIPSRTGRAVWHKSTIVRILARV